MTTSVPISDIDSHSVFSHNLFNSDFEFNYHNMDEQINLRELIASDVNYNALCIEYPEVVAPFKLKYGLIHLLSRFNGLAGEDPHRHLKEFQVVYSIPLRPR